MPKKRRGKPCLFEDVDKLRKSVDEYFEVCDKEKQPPLITELALHLGTSRQCIVDYKNKVHKDKNKKWYKEARQILLDASARCEAFLERALIAPGKCTGVIFNLKNNYGWKDKTEVENTIKGNVINVITKK